MRGNLKPWVGSVDHRLARTAEELLGACEAYLKQGPLHRNGFKLYRRDRGPRPDTVVAIQLLGVADGMLVVEPFKERLGYRAAFIFEVPVSSGNRETLYFEGFGPTVEQSVTEARDSFFVFLQPFAKIGDRLSGGALIVNAVDTAMMTKGFKP